MARSLPPHLEEVEDRTLLSTVTWISNASGNWSNPANWSGGSVPASTDDAVIPVAGITVTHDSGDDSVKSLVSQANITLSGGSLALANASSVTGTLEVSGTVTLNGTLDITGALTVDVGATFGGSAVLSVGGLFTWHGGISVIKIASIDAKAGLDYDASDGAYLAGTQLTLHGASQLHTGTGSILLSKGASITNLGSMTVNVTGADGYTIADDDADSVTSFTNGATGTITKQGTGSFGVSTDVAVNNGSINVTGGTLAFEDGAADSSSGSFLGSAGTTLQLRGSLLAANSSVTSSGAVDLGGDMVVAGLYKVQGPGSTTISGKTTFTGDLEGLGDGLTVAEDQSVDLSPTKGPGTATVKTLTLKTVTTLAGTLKLTATGLFTWHSAYTNVSIATIDAKGGVDYESTIDTHVVGTQITLHGTSAFHSGMGSIYLAAGASITNLGSLTVDAKGTDSYQIFGADSTTSFINAHMGSETGTITKTGDGEFGIHTDTALNNGSIDVQGGKFFFENASSTIAATGSFHGNGGTTLQLGGCILGASSSITSTGEVDLENGLVTAGLYNVQAPGGTSVAGTSVELNGDVEGLGAYLSFVDAGSIDISPAKQPSSLAVGTLTLAPFSSLVGTLKLTVSGLFTWHSGLTTIGIAALDAEGGTKFDAANSSYLKGTQLTLNGNTQFQSGTGSIALSYGAAITNLGTMTVNDTGTDSNYIFGDDIDAFLSTLTSFTNKGTITKTGGGSFGITTDVAVNTGTIGVQGGTFFFKERHVGDASTGTITAAAGTTLQLGGCAFTAASSITSAGDVELSQSVVVAGLYNVQAPGRTLITGASQITGDLESLGKALVFSENGELLISPSAGPARLNVETLTLVATSTLILGKAVIHGAAPRGFATHEATTATGPTLAVTQDVTNPGTVYINNGATLVAPGYDQPGGTTILDGGVIQAPVVLDGGDLEGPGTIGDDLTNTGNLLVGGTGPLIIFGDFVQVTTGLLDIALGVGTAGTAQIQVTGSVNLAGTLKVHGANQFSPAPGDEYRILTFSARSGDFSQKLLTPVGEEKLTAVYDSTGLTLHAPANDSSTALTITPTAPSNQAIILSATVSTTALGAAPSGTVTFLDGSTPLATVNLTNGTASFSASALSVGEHSISAVYNGSETFVVSTSPVQQLLVSDALALTPSAPKAADSVTATVSGSNANGSASFVFVWSATHGGVAHVLATNTPAGNSDTINLGSYSIAVGDTLTCTVTPNDGTSVVTREVAIDDDAPVAADQSVSLNENTSTTITLTATDSDDDPLTYAVFTSPVHGLLTRKSNGVYTYTPADNFNGNDSLTFTATDGTLISNVATVAITVHPVNQPPTASAESAVTSDSTGAAAITFQGADVETPAGQLVYTIVTLPSSGTLFASDGKPVAVGKQFVGSAAALSYVLPLKVFGDFSATFKYTVTDTGDPAGTPSNVLTSLPATVTIQTPPDSAGIVRIHGTLGNDAISLTRTANSGALHVTVNGTAAGSDVPLASIKSIQVIGRGGNDSYSVSTGLAVPIAIQAGAGNDALTSSATNLTFDGGGGQDKATITIPSGKHIATLRPLSAMLTGTAYSVTIAKAGTLVVHGGSKDTANLYGSLHSDALTATPRSATLRSSTFTEQITGFGIVNAYAVAGGTDTADLTGSKGTDTFTATPLYGLLTGPGYAVRASGFASVTAHAAGGTDTANFVDSSGNDTFTAQPSSSAMTSGHFANKAIGFTVVNASASKGTDRANLTDAALAGFYSGTGKKGTLSGPGYTINVNQFGTVQVDGRKSTKNTIHVSALSYTLKKLGTWTPK